MTTIQQLAIDFWILMSNVWTEGFLGIDFGRILIAALIFIGFYILRGLFAKIVVVALHRWAQRSETQFDDMLINAIAPSLKLLVVTMGVFVAGQYLALEGVGATILLNVERSMVVIAIFWALYNITQPLTLVFKRLEAVLTREMVDWLITATRIGVVLLGVATVLQVWGIQVAPLIAGLGLLGVAVALGAQDLFKNLLAGLSILVEKRFGVGDWVKVNDVVEGTVEHIGFRSTRIRRFDKAPVFVPNTEFADGAVTNFSAMSHRRIYWKIGVEYRTTKAQLQEIRNCIEGYLVNTDAFAKPPEVPMFVRIDAFNDSSIDIMIYCFTRTIVWGEWLEAKEQLAYAIKDIVEDAGTGFAFPSTSLYLESLPVGTPEIFTPPTDKLTG
ncbi:mechanosensitive ion channel family protein [Pyruvatibacter sp.]|uniref:mechanosensitive ion channel family protein n=1 Tax=Pyruvatibacter sp. TaxID=1981328 RepID=UPI0032EAF65E